jgi:hypothetical protein
VQRIKESSADEGRLHQQAFQPRTALRQCILLERNGPVQTLIEQVL